MTIPIALFIKHIDKGYYFVCRNLTNNEEYNINVEPITSVTTAYKQFDKVVEAFEKYDRYDVQYVSENII